MVDKELVITNIRAVILYDGSLFAAHESYNPNLPCCELIYKFDGESIIRFAGKTATEKENYVRFLPKGPQPHGSQYTVDILTPGKCIDVYFDTPSAIPHEMLLWNLNNNLTIQSLFAKMQKLWFAKHDGYYHQCLSLMYTILSEFEKIEQTVHSYLPENQYALIKPAIEYLDQNFSSNDIDCQSLCALCGISYSYFKRLFLRKFRLSPVKYLTKKRITYACDLLAADKYSVSDIAAITGYSDVYYFSRIFKKTTGLSPLEYKKSL